MDECLLDTDILNEVLKQKNAVVVQNASQYLSQYGSFCISSMTRYEVVRGLREKNATAQIRRFEGFCQNALILPVSDVILDRAATLWADGRSAGLAPNDADLIIAATAIEHGRTLVTGNTVHFQWIPGLSIGNWRNLPP